MGGSAPNEGRVEVKAFNYPWGGICDDGFGLEEAAVVCREAGFPQGAKEAAINSRFGSGEVGRQDILIDELNCMGDEGSLLECRFDPWTKHDCSHKEWAGVVCKTEEDGCGEDEVGGRSEAQQSRKQLNLPSLITGVALRQRRVRPPGLFVRWPQGLPGRVGRGPVRTVRASRRTEASGRRCQLFW